MYEEGMGVSRDLTEAAKWYQKAADKGAPRAQLTLAKMYRDGKGMPQDLVQAYKWAHMAASQKAQEAIKIRDELAQRMPPRQFAEAVRLAHEFEMQTEKKKEQIQLEMPES
jgi:hypothetical protein